MILEVLITNYAKSCITEQFLNLFANNSGREKEMRHMIHLYLKMANLKLLKFHCKILTRPVLDGSIAMLKHSW